MHPRPTRRATRADVARLAGVSPAVVSFTLNGGPRPVADATARRVREAVARLGYTPNAAARALSMGSSGVLGLVVHDIANPADGRLAARVQEAADERGMDVVVAGVLEDRSRSLGALQALDARQVDGIVVTTPLSPEAVDGATRLRARIVQLGSHGAIPGVVRLEADVDEGSAAIVAHLAALGHRRVASVGARAGACSSRRGAHGRAVEDGPSEPDAASMRAGYEGMRRILAHEVPTAVVAGSDVVALGILRAIREAGLRVPEDVSVVGFGDTDEARFASPALTTVHVPAQEMARDALLALVEPTALEPGEHRYPTRLVVRESTAPPRA
ncbi:LacI family DNA-binding transcriptional regulator [Agrococcus versicolor]|uniref:LacI family DNA-binding transcriptional regulator n=1 Tax=Agrococcus versicolor TaxID=501482 RepID=A0ABP5MU31_9MICO